MHKRIVVTGLGVVSSIGIGKDEFWQSLIKGKSGISQIERFDTTDYPNHLGGEVKNFRPEDFINQKKIPHLGRASCLAIASAKLAIGDARLNLKDLNKEKMGVVLGTTMGESQIFERLNEAWVKKGEEGLDKDLILKFPTNVLSSNVAIEFEVKGPNFVIPTACAAGNYAIGYAYDQLRKGVAEVMLAGGTDAFSKIAFCGFNRLLAIAPEMCQPFDKNRKGMMLGEGAGVVVLEPLENALKRKIDIYAEILGYGLSCDAYHMTAPDASGIAWAMKKALRESNIRPEAVDYINAHGTGTPANDLAECLAIKQVFGGHAKKLCISSIKSMLGHTMGAASAIEAIACCLAVKNDIIPPTINYETPDPDCDLDCVPNACRRQKVEVALNNSLAFGGNNACLVLKKFIPS
jgi:3-oxoacyl-[acyl-carrier-protein] synthase II